MASFSVQGCFIHTSFPLERWAVNCRIFHRVYHCEAAGVLLAESELQAMSDYVAPAVEEKEDTHPTRTNVWQATFSPQMNSNMKRLNRDYYDNVEDPHKSATVWENIVKAENIKRISFEMFDKNNDGMIDAADLRASLGDQANVEDLIRQVDKNKDGKIDYTEFCELLKDS